MTLPQAFRVALPATRNQLIDIVGLVDLAVIGVRELMREDATTRQPALPSVRVLHGHDGVYLGLVAIVSFVMNRVEKALRVNERGPRVRGPRLFSQVVDRAAPSKVGRMTAMRGSPACSSPRRRPDLSIEQFQQYWRNEHATITLTFPHVGRYVQNHAVVRDGTLVLPSPGLRRLLRARLRLRRRDGRLVVLPEYFQGEQDENNFIDPRWSTVLVGTRHRFGDARAASLPARLVVLEPKRPTSLGRTHRPGRCRRRPSVVRRRGGRDPRAPRPGIRLRTTGAILWLGDDDLAQLGGLLRSLLDVVVSDLGRNEHGALTVVEPNIVIGSQLQGW